VDGPNLFHIYTNQLFIEGLSREAWVFTLGHERGHWQNGDPRRMRHRNRYWESYADMRAIDTCLALGYDPVRAMHEIKTRFDEWASTSEYIELGSLKRAMEELAWRLNRIRRVMETL
jgi:hypothetical protein